MSGEGAHGRVDWIGYTTLYREGGPRLRRAAETMARQLRQRPDAVDVRCKRVECKRDFVEAMRQVAAEGKSLRQLHFVGHSGMYGPMFRTTAMPEQFSPHEWRNLQLPFGPDASAFFHACRTGRWFAPFFARTFGVPAYGYHWYTTFSTSPDRFRWESPWADPEGPLYLIGCPGRKSHGLAGSLLKYGGLAAAETMQRFEPAGDDNEGSYDSVAALYDQVFDDIRVRRDEWRWLQAHLPARCGLRVLDIGCGNGALLEALAPQIAWGGGVDTSAAMLELARARNAASPHLSFARLQGPTLPFEDHSVDVVVSLLSFRYLDWDPLMNELMRVMRPGAKLLVVDMVTAPVAASELGKLVAGKLRSLGQRLTRPRYHRALTRLVADPAWARMLEYNPIRAQHELVWYLQSRFPGRKVETLNVGWHARVLAFDSGPLDRDWVAPQSYP